jgi:hypothetical protein
MSQSKLVIAILAAVAGLVAIPAQARGGLDVHWQVQIGLPVPVVVVRAPRVYVPPPVYVQPHSSGHDGHRHPRTAHAYPYGSGYGPRTHWDVDGDGIPNHRDRAYNPRWDRDGDGVPNRYDHRDDRFRR